LKFRPLAAVYQSMGLFYANLVSFPQYSELSKASLLYLLTLTELMIYQYAIKGFSNVFFANNSTYFICFGSVFCQ